MVKIAWEGGWLLSKWCIMVEFALHIDTSRGVGRQVSHRPPRVAGFLTTSSIADPRYPMIGMLILSWNHGVWGDRWLGNLTV